MIISLILISQISTCCIHGIKGTGKIIKSEREVKDFKSIVVKSGIDLILRQDTIEKVLVETYENLQKIIKTEVADGELKIYTAEHIYYPSTLKVYVTIKRINSLDASSGADVKSESMLDLPNLKVSASSGSDIKLDLACSDLQVESSSGSDINLSGRTGKLIIRSSSGSDFNGDRLTSETCSVIASSGSDVKVAVSKKIEAHASSGSDILVNGNPMERDIEKSSGGDVNFK